jgi:chemotaxis protein CheD
MIAELPGIRVQPGELYLARSPMILQTILGSCVSVTFRSAKLGAAALCHGVLPRCPRGTVTPDGYRYVDFSIRYLASQFESLGANRNELEVKVFGGADVLSVSLPRMGKPTVGALNCEAALDVLSELGFHLAASDLGGPRGRTIHFDTGTGEVRVHRLDAMHGSAASHGNHRRSAGRKGVNA